MEHDEILSTIAHLDHSFNGTSEYKDALALLSQIDGAYLPLLFLPPNKAVWHGCAHVLKLIGFPRLESVISLMLEWFQDLNYPGVDLIVDALESCRKDFLIRSIEVAVRDAHSCRDESWVGGLKYLVGRLSLCAEDFNDSDIFELLQRSDFY